MLVHLLLVNNLTSQLSTSLSTTPTLFAHLPQRDSDFFCRHFHYSLLWSSSSRFVWKIPAASCWTNSKPQIHFHGWIPMQVAEQRPINFQMCSTNNCKLLKPLIKKGIQTIGRIKVCSEPSVTLEHYFTTFNQDQICSCLPEWMKKTM